MYTNHESLINEEVFYLWLKPVLFQPKTRPKNMEVDMGFDLAQLKALENTLQNILTGVYSQAEVKALLLKLRQLVVSQQSYQGREHQVDQSDVVLITYGDSIFQHGIAPLQTLHDFLNEHVKVELSAVHILPCYPYTSDDGFSVTDYWKINPELGDWDDIDSLSSDYDLMLDAVINHISQSSDWFQGFLLGDERYNHFFTQANPNCDYSSVTRPRALPLLTPFDTAEGVKHIWTTFSEDQIDLNYRNPDVFLKIAELLLFYVEQGATFIRLDAVGFMWKELGTPCIHQPQTHAIIQAYRAIMDRVAPHVKLITETNVPHKDNISYFGNGANEAHLVYQFPLPPLTLHTIQGGDSTRFMDWMIGLEPCSPETTYFNFLASHDGIGVRPVEGILTDAELDVLLNHVQANGGRVSYKDNGDGTQSPYELNINYFDAVCDLRLSEDLNLKRFMAAQSILLSLAGVPGIYIHSLLGSGNDQIGLERLGYHRAINREKLDRIQLEKELANPSTRRAVVLKHFKHLLTTRQQCPSFAPHTSQRVVKTNHQLITFVRDEAVAVIINISSQAVELDSRLLLENLSNDLISGAHVKNMLTLLPYQVMWLSS